MPVGMIVRCGCIMQYNYLGLVAFVVVPLVAVYLWLVMLSRRVLPPPPANIKFAHPCLNEPVGRTLSIITAC